MARLWPVIVPDEPDIQSGRSDGSSQADIAWGDIPHDRRVDWSRLQLDFPPTWSGTVMMIATVRAVKRDRYTSMAGWVDVARSFEGAGFTPDQYYTLRLCLGRCVPGDHRKLLAHPFITATRSPSGYVCTTIRAADWVKWPELLLAGETPLGATRLVLDGGSKRMPDGLIIDLEGNIIVSTES